MKTAKDARKELDAAVRAKYGDLQEIEIKTLPVDDKWFASIQTAIEAEVKRIKQRLADWGKELEERYALPLPALGESIEVLSLRVEDHLRQMYASRLTRKSSILCSFRTACGQRRTGTG